MSKYDKKHYVYQIKFPDEMRYIGCTYDIRQRMRTHATNPNKTLKSYLVNSGYVFTDAELSVLEIAEDKTEGHAIERKYFYEFDDKEILINRFKRKKERKIMSIEMPDGKTEKVDIIKESMFKNEEAGK